MALRWCLQVTDILSIKILRYQEAPEFYHPGLFLCVKKHVKHKFNKRLKKHLFIIKIND